MLLLYIELAYRRTTISDSKNQGQRREVINYICKVHVVDPSGLLTVVSGDALFFASLEEVIKF